MCPSVRTTRWHGMKYGIGLLASAVPTARTAAGRPISRATHPYGRTSPRGISRVLRSTACSNAVNPRRSKRMRFLPLSSSWIFSARSGEATAGISGRPTSLPNQSSNSSADTNRAAADTPNRFQATNTSPRTVSKRAYESAIPTCARTRSAKPAGALTAPSLFRSVVNAIIGVSSQQFQPTVYVGLHSSHRLPQRFGSLRIRELTHMAEHNRLSIAGGKPGDPRRQLVDLHPLHHLRLGTLRVVGLAAVELNQSRVHTAHPVPDHVDGDAVQPGTLLQFPYPFWRVGAKSVIRAQECVLGHLFRIVAVARHRQACGEYAVLVLPHHPLEEVVDALHHTPMNTSDNRFVATGTMMPPRL